MVALGWPGAASMTTSPTIDRIRSATDLVSLVASYIQLRKSGSAHVAKCPFHGPERTPSFNISPAKQLWHCHGCEAGGDAFTFLQKIEGITFSAALKALADRAGIPLDEQAPRVTPKEAAYAKSLVDEAAEFHGWYVMWLEVEREHVYQEMLAGRATYTDLMADAEYLYRAQHILPETLIRLYVDLRGRWPRLPVFFRALRNRRQSAGGEFLKCYWELTDEERAVVAGEHIETVLDLARVALELREYLGERAA